MNDHHLEMLVSDGWRTALRDSIMPWALEATDLGDDVLEVGPGPGLTTDILRELVPSLTAVELDPELAAGLATRLAGSNVEVVEADATAMPFTDRRFSGAVSFTMLHHVPTAALQDALFADVARVLRPGGVLVAFDGIGNDDLSGLHVGDVYNPVDPTRVAQRLRSAGFDEIEVRTNDFAWTARATTPTS